jgi:peptide/nickel transport system substrate-binding protein
MRRNDWDRLNRRFGRRRVLAGIGVTGIGVAGLATGCTTTAETPTVGPTAVATAAPTARSGAAPAGAPTATAVAAKYGGTIRTSRTGVAPHLDPHQTAASPASAFGWGNAYSRFLKYKVGPDVKYPGFIPVGDVAESWQQNDETTYTFKLRPNVKWHNIAPVNGRAFTAEDAVYSITRMKTKGFATAPTFAIVDRAEAVDPLTVRLRLTGPDADLLSNLGNPYAKMVAREAVELKGDLKEGPTIGTAPWVLERDEPNGGSYLVRNPVYFLKGLPYADRLEWLVITDLQTIIAALRSKQLDAQMTGIEKDDAEQLKKADPSLVITVLRDVGGTELIFRCDRPPFADVRVRQAVSKAIDRDAIGSALWGGSVWYNANITMPAADWYLPEAEVASKVKRDLDGARQLLKQAGAEGAAFEIGASNISGGIYVQSAELLQAQLKEVGLNPRLKAIDQTLYSTLAVSGGEFDILTGPVNPATSANEDLLGRWHSKGERAISKHNDPELDKLIEQQARTTNPDDRKKLLVDIQRMAFDRLYRLCVNGRQRSVLSWPHLKNFYPGPGSSYYDHWTTMWVDK